MIGLWFNLFFSTNRLDHCHLFWLWLGFQSFHLLFYRGFVLVQHLVFSPWLQFTSLPCFVNRWFQFRLYHRACLRHHCRRCHRHTGCGCCWFDLDLCHSWFGGEFKFSWWWSCRFFIWVKQSHWNGTDVSKYPFSPFYLQPHMLHFMKLDGYLAQKAGLNVWNAFPLCL